MKHLTVGAWALLMTLGLGTGAAQAAEPQCELDRPVVFSGLDYASAAFHNAVASKIIEAGYGCETDSIPGSTLPLLAGLAKGDVDVTMEIWLDNITEPWQKAVDAGQVKSLGTNFPDAVQGWYVPRYVQEGDEARGVEPIAPELTAVKDLPDYKELFTDPEEPGKGRFYNCILGWNCEVVNTKKLEAYGLTDDYTNFRPGAAAALSAAIASAYEQREPILAYYWGPTWVLGKYDMVMLEEPAFDQQVWDDLSEQEHPEKACAYPVVEVVIGANTGFIEAAPKLVEFLTNYETSNALISKALAFMQDHEGATADDAAENFLKTRPEIWTEWVPEEVAARVKAQVM